MSEKEITSRLIKTPVELSEKAAGHKIFCVILSQENCGPCKAMYPVMSALMAENLGVEFGYVNLSESAGEFAAFLDEHEVKSVPRIMIFSAGQLQKHFTGAQRKEDIQKAIDIAKSKGEKE